MSFVLFSKSDNNTKTNVNGLLCLQGCVIDSPMTLNIMLETINTERFTLKKNKKSMSE